MSANFEQCRLHDAGLLTFCRLLEGGPDADGGAHSRFNLDKSLLTTLVDRWRPETHTFHLPCGEMAPTLQDVSYLLGLPLLGTAVGPQEVAASWRLDMEERFAGVQRRPDLPPLTAHPAVAGPQKAWLLQFEVTSHTRSHLRYCFSL